MEVFGFQHCFCHSPHHSWGVGFGIGWFFSMSREGTSYDNVVIVTFFPTLKPEVAHRPRWRTRAGIFEPIEGCYNRKPVHSNLGYCSPVEYEERRNRP